MHRSTVDQINGRYDSGLVHCEYVDVVTDYRDWSLGTMQDGIQWDDLDEGDQIWWSDFLEAMHAQQVRLAELYPAQHAHVTEQLPDLYRSGDVEDYPHFLERIIDDAEASIGKWE